MTQIFRKFEFAQNLDINGKNGTQDGALIWKSDQRKLHFWNIFTKIENRYLANKDIGNIDIKNFSACVFQDNNNVLVFVKTTIQHSSKFDFLDKIIQ